MTRPADASGRRDPFPANFDPARMETAIMKTRFAFLLLAAAGLLPVAWVVAQQAETPPAEATEEAGQDAVSQQAQKLEAELVKLSDNSPEAAGIMLQLVDLYHQNGRVFGLIQIGQRFIARHSDHPQHAEVMLKTIDGLTVTARNKDLLVLARQFIQRYEQHPRVAEIELLVARTLVEMGSSLEAAAAYESYWKRQPNSPAGIQAGLTASNIYAATNDNNYRNKSGELREAIYDALPANDGTLEVGMQAHGIYRTAGLWAKANIMANKLLKKTPPADKNRLRYLYETMAHDYQQLGQHANAVQSWKQARALQDRNDLHRNMIVAMHYAGASSADLEAAINEYYQKYPQREDRFAMRTYLPLAYLREQNTARAVQVMAELLPFDALTNNLAGLYVQYAGTEPAQLAQAEQALTAAVQQNKKHAAYLRYVLALQLYRDRIKDVAKAKQVARDLLRQSPSNDGYTGDTLKWLLSAAESDAEFNSDLQLALAARQANPHWPNLRAYLPQWAQEAAKVKELAPRAKAVSSQVAAQDNTDLFKDWAGTFGDWQGPAQKAREKVLASHPLNDEQAWQILYYLGYYYRHYGDGNYRNQSPRVYAEFAKRFPDRYEVAQWFLEVATDYGSAEYRREALVHMLKFEPAAVWSDGWRRMMIAADSAADADLVKQAYAWIEKCRQQHGFDSNYADSIGDALEKYELKQEALAWWQLGYRHDPNSYYSKLCAQRLLQRTEDPAARKKFLEEAIALRSDNHGYYAQLLADDYFRAGDWDNFEKVLRSARTAQDARLYRGWAMEETFAQQWLDNTRANMELDPEVKRRVYTVVRDLQLGRQSAAAAVALLELPSAENVTPIDRLLALHSASYLLGNDANDFDRLFPFAQAAMNRKDYLFAATFGTTILSNVNNIDDNRRKAARDLVGLAYSRLGSVGLAIDESSPIAPLLQAALYLRLGDERMAWDTYVANQQLFDQHRLDVPVDLLVFVSEHYIAAGGDANHDRVEDLLRGWLVAKSEQAGIEDRTKARVQLMLAKNYFKARRYEVARSEFTTVINRYKDTPEAIEAQFGIGETFLEQKVYDQAEAVFEKLAASRDRETVVRAEFLRGVLANRRGDRDEARDIFRQVLERVPSVELANQALFNLSEIYGAEQRFMDQLELLRTIGRLGNQSKRWHAPGMDLSIVVQDPDLAVSKGHSRIPVVVTTAPGGDREMVYLYSGGAGKGLFRADLQTALGDVQPDDHVLQVNGNDVIKVDYPEEFKADFRSVVLTNTEMRIAANGVLAASSSQIVDQEEESFSKQLEREQLEEEVDQRVSQNRPTNQIKPGNLIHLQVKDPDRDLTSEPDEVLVKLAASSGDVVQVTLRETGPHTGVFEGTAQTGELPAGALASDTAIDHSPLMAIDNDPKTAWMSEPDGATPKWLSVDMKELKHVERVSIYTPDPNQHAPVRGELQGSHDGQFWFRIGTVPRTPPVANVAGEFDRMKLRVYEGNFTGYSNWQQVVELSTTGKPIVEEEVQTLSWSLTEESEDKGKPYAALWHGKILQGRSGAARIAVLGNVTALVLDGELLLPLGPGNRSVDVWLDRGTHDLTVFSALAQAQTGASATMARADYNTSTITPIPFQPADFDLDDPLARPALPRESTRVTAADGIWDFQFDPLELRHVRLQIHEYLGESVAVSHVEVRGEEGTVLHIPTQEDVLGLAENDVLELAAGDTLTASYLDEFTQTVNGGSRLLTQNLQATYFNGSVTPITYQFRKAPNGTVVTTRLNLLRIEPGDRFIVEITDFDMDQTDQPDTVTFQVQVNDGEPIELTAQETEPFSGIFTKEVDTSPGEEKDKLTVKPGDRIYCTYIDGQNTFPGHAVARETVVLVNEPSQAQVRIVESRLIPAEAENQAPVVRFLPADSSTPDKIAGVAFGVPLTVEIIDPDRALHSGSAVTVQLETTDGSKAEVRCVLSDEFSSTPDVVASAVQQGRFVGQIVMQLGTKNSPDLVPRTTDMPTNLIGGPVLSDEEAGPSTGVNLITRVLNVTGKDIITATYPDERRPDGTSADLSARGRLIANGQLACTDHDYEKPVEMLHVGEKMYLKVVDPDRDESDDRDVVPVELRTDRGELEVVQLQETLAHSGVFTGSVGLEAVEKPTPENADEVEPVLETYFGDTITVKYVDTASSNEAGNLELLLEIPVVIGTDGLVAAFSKTFDDESLAVETQFRIAESYFELFKSHKNLGREEEQKIDLEAGKRVLREVMEDHPEPKYAARIAYLLGQFAQELEHWDEAISSYQMIVRQFSDHTLAPDAQYKLAQCYEESGNFNEALEAYVTLAATYPQSPLIASVMIRICDRFYKLENYEVAAQVGEKFAEKFPNHQYTSRMAFRVGQCYWKAKDYARAARAFDTFYKVYPDDELAPQALFWSGESFREANNNIEAFRRYNRCRWDFPRSDAAKYARGRLALPQMLQLFEQEANAVEQDQ